MAVGFKDFLNVDYTQTGDGQLAKNAKKRKGFTGGGTDAEYASTHEPRKTDEALTMQQRRARARQMKKYQSRLKVGRKKAAAKIANQAVLKRRAQKAARAAIAKKITKGIPKAELTPARKQEIEKRLDKMQPRINRVAKKLLPQLRKAELARKRG
jgi:hypothetical protein